MPTNPAVEQNNNIKWSVSPWNQSGGKGKCLWRSSLYHRPANLPTFLSVYPLTNSFQMSCA